MYLGLAIMFVGLVLLGTTIVKIWGTGVEEKVRTWYGIALVGVILAMTGLVLTLQGMQKAGRQPQITGIPDKKPVAEKTEPRERFKPKNTPKPSPKEKASPAKRDENLPQKAKKRRNWMRKQLKEDPEGKPYTAEDFRFIDTQMDKIDKGFEQMKQETFYGEKPPDKANIPDRELWNNFSFNMGIRLRNIRKRAAYRHGPGTAEIKKRLFAIVKFMSKIQRVYHTAVAENKPVDYQYISDLRSHVERLTREINELRKKQGIGEKIDTKK